MQTIRIPVYTAFGLVFLFLAYVSADMRGKPITTGGIEQVLIPKGEVWLGSDDAEKEYAYGIGGAAARKYRWYDKEIKRRLFVDEFYIDKYPVTQESYLEFVKATGHRVPYISRGDYQKQGFLVHPYKEVLPYLWKNGTPPAGMMDHPVALVSVGDAWDYCDWRGRGSADRLFRLPFEDEWEKAARGTDGRYFPWGNEWNNENANIWRSGPHTTTPVDKYNGGRSPYGVYDMAGNVFEWTITPVKPHSDRYVLKSCSWDDLPGICRGAARHARLKSSRHILIGFRCVSIPAKRDQR